MPDNYVKLDLSGWIVLDKLLQSGDEVIIRARVASVFDEDVKATIRKISSNNLIALDNIRDLNDQSLNYPHLGWLDVMWDVWKQAAASGEE